MIPWAWLPGPAAALALTAGMIVWLLAAWWRHGHLALLSRWSSVSLHRGRKTSSVRAVMLMTAATCLSVSVFKAEHGARAGAGTAPPVLFLLDGSRSMDVADLTPSRRAAAIAIVRRLVAGPPAIQAGIMVFAGNVLLACPFTIDYRAVEMALDDLPNSIATLPGGSALDLALAEALRTLLRTSRRGSIVLLSDGESTTGELGEVTALATAAGVAIHTVGMGTPEGGIMSVHRALTDAESGASETRVSRLNSSRLQALAEATGGRHFAGEGDEAARQLEAQVSAAVSEFVPASSWRIEWLLLALALGALSIELALRHVRVWA